MCWLLCSESARAPHSVMLATLFSRRAVGYSVTQSRCKICQWLTVFKFTLGWLSLLHWHAATWQVMICKAGPIKAGSVLKFSWVTSSSKSVPLDSEFQVRRADPGPGLAAVAGQHLEPWVMWYHSLGYDIIAWCMISHYDITSVISQSWYRPVILNKADCDIIVFTMIS